MIANVLADVAVRDIGAATRWYAALLGRAPDATPMDSLAEWRFDDGGVAIIRDPDGNQMVFAEGRDDAHRSTRG